MTTTSKVRCKNFISDPISFSLDNLFIYDNHLQTLRFILKENNYLFSPAYTYHNSIIYINWIHFRYINLKYAFSNNFIVATFRIFLLEM